MRYSFIIPTLNEEKLLPNLLAQLNDTTLKDNYSYEIIVSDGGSTDSTIEIASSSADKVILHQESTKQNIAAGRNAGAQNAEGEIFIFLNGDVVMENPVNFMQYVENKFLQSDYSAMTCSVVVAKYERKISDALFLNFYNIYFHLLNIIGMGMGRGECHIIKSSIFRRYNGYNDNLAAGEDFDLFTRIRKNGKILFARKIRIFESPRRYRKIGHFKILFTWLLNSAFVLFKNRSISKEWVQIR